MGGAIRKLTGDRRGQGLCSGLGWGKSKDGRATVGARRKARHLDWERTVWQRS